MDQKRKSKKQKCIDCCLQAKRNMEEKKWMSVAQMGDLLGLKKTERYWLVHKQYFETKQIRGKLMSRLENRRFIEA